MAVGFVSKISLPTKSADSTDIRDFVFSSEAGTLKNDPSLTGKTTLAVASGSGYEIKTIPHGLNYTPAFEVYYKADDNAWHHEGVVVDYASTPYFLGFSYADENNLYFQGNTDGATNFTFEIKYFIFRNET